MGSYAIFILSSITNNYDNDTCLILKLKIEWIWITEYSKRFYGCNQYRIIILNIKLLDIKYWTYILLIFELQIKKTYEK